MSILTGMGNPLLDTIIQVDFETFREFEAEPGSMNLVDSTFSQKLMQLPGNKKGTPGGSCSNTMRGIAWIMKHTGEKDGVAYLGAVGKDKEGDQFESILREQGVAPYLARTDVATGTSTILVTPDHERTMFTYLGACREYREEDLPANSYSIACCIHLAGYMWDTENQKGAAKKLVQEGLKEQKVISFDLADPFVVHRFGDELRSWLPGKVHILFANKEELSVMTGESENSQILERAKEFARTVVMKIGAEGCSIVSGNEIITVPGERVQPMDTTGAGDSFAAGYLYGMLHNYSPRVCGKLANRIASKIVTTEGCDYSAVSFDEVKELVGHI